MPAVIDKALDFIGAMDVSAPTPSSMNESTAKGIFKYLKNWEYPRVPLILRRELTRKAGTWVHGKNGWMGKKMETGERSVIKNPEYFSTYMQEELKALV